MYPFEYMDSFNKFSDDKVPDRCKFFSSLKDEYISEKDYLHAIDFWIMFKMNTVDVYHEWVIINFIIAIIIISWCF